MKCEKCGSEMNSFSIVTTDDCVREKTRTNNWYCEHCISADGRTAIQQITNDYNRGWNEALEAVFNKLHSSYFVDGKPALVIHEDNSQKPAMPDMFELINLLKK